MYSMILIQVDTSFNGMDGSGSTQMSAAAHNDTIKVLPAKLEGQMPQRPQEVIDAILRVHNANVAQNALAHLSQPLAWRMDGHPPKIRPVPDHESLLRFHAASLDLELFIRLIRRDRDVCQLEAAFLHKAKSSGKDVVIRSVPRLIELGRKIMVVEDEFLAKGLVQSGDEKQRIWRVVRVDHIKTVLECNV